MAIRTLKYNVNYSANLNVDAGTQTYITQTKYNLTDRADVSFQNTFDLVATVENTIVTPGLISISLISWNSIDPVSLALELDNQLTPQPIYTTPSTYGVLKFGNTVPLILPTFIKFKSNLNTSVEVVIIGNR